MKRMIFMFLFGAVVSTLAAQEKVYQINEVSVINYGDGRLLFRQTDKDKSPLNGEHRIIDGYRSEYILANFKDGMYDGKYQHFKRENLAEEATYKEGRLEGTKKSYYQDGKTVENEASFINGKLNGIRKTYRQNGAIETEKGYKMGVEDGPERRYDYETGKLTTDTYYKDGKRDGNWIESITSNVGNYTKRSSYKDGILQNEYSEIWEDGNPRTKGSYKDGKKDGVWTQFYKDGKPRQSTTYKADLKNGEDCIYFTDGSKEKSTMFVNDKRDGLMKEFFNGTGKVKYECNFKTGKREGTYKRFYDDGVLREEGRYEDDSEVYRKEYYTNGKLKSVAERQNGSWNTIEQYDVNGNKK